MGILSFLRRAPDAGAAGQSPRADAEEFLGYGLDDPALVEFLRAGLETASGVSVSSEAALRNMAVFRCVDLISSSIGMLPLYLVREDASGALSRVKDHPLYDVLLHQPNNWQTPFEFKSQMQLNLLTEGAAYALIIWSRGRVLRLVPLKPSRMTWKQNADWSISYRYVREDGRSVEYSQSEILHLRGLTRDGLTGLNRTALAKEAIGLALQAEKAAARLFGSGIIAGGWLTTPKSLSDTAYNRLVESLKQRRGAEAAHRWQIGEEGLEPKGFPSNGRDAQTVEQRKHQVEDISRAYGVPRPFLMLDDTSWGTGIEVLGKFYVQYGLAPWFCVWEQGISLSCLSKEERREGLKPDFDERELLRGSMKDQADFLSKALGAGGSRPWMTQNEGRDLVGLGRREDADADSLRNPMTQKTGAAGGTEGGGANGGS